MKCLQNFLATAYASRYLTESHNEFHWKNDVYAKLNFESYIRSLNFEELTTHESLYFWVFFSFSILIFTYTFTFKKEFNIFVTYSFCQSETPESHIMLHRIPNPYINVSLFYVLLFDLCRVFMFDRFALAFFTLFFFFFCCC